MMVFSCSLSLKCSPLVFTLVALATFKGSVSFSYASESFYEVDPTMSSYSFLVPPEGPGIDECVPNSFQCDFGIQGNLIFEVAENGQTARFIGGELLTIGNEPAFPDAPFNLAVSGGPLLSAEFDLVSVTTEMTLFRDSRFRDTGINPYTMQVQLSGENLILTGGNNFTFTDGSGFELRLNAFLVPEPSNWTLVVITAVLLTIPSRYLSARS